MIRRGSRAGKSVGEQSSIFLSPVILALIAATIAVTITVVVVTDNNNSTSP